MYTPLITWGCIVGLLLLMLILYSRKLLVKGNKTRKNVIELTTEREEFYIPGDPNPIKLDEYDNRNFD